MKTESNLDIESKHQTILINSSSHHYCQKAPFPKGITSGDSAKDQRSILINGLFRHFLVTTSPKLTNKYTDLLKHFCKILSLQFQKSVINSEVVAFIIIILFSKVIMPISCT